MALDIIPNAYPELWSDTAPELPPMIGIYGTSGVGKTSIAAAFPKPIIGMAEQGLRDVKLKNIPNFRIQNINDLYMRLTAFCQLKDQGKLPFQTLVIDSMDHMLPVIAAAVCAKNNWTDIEQPYGKGKAALNDAVHVLLMELLKFRELTGMAIVLLAHEQSQRVSDPEVGEYVRYSPKLPDKATDYYMELCDAVFRASHQMVVSAATQNAAARAITSGQRVFVTTTAGHSVAKNSFGMPQNVRYWLDEKTGAVNLSELAGYIPWLQERM